MGVSGLGVSYGSSMSLLPVVTVTRAEDRTRMSLEFSLVQAIMGWGVPRALQVKLAWPDEFTTLLGVSICTDGVSGFEGEKRSRRKGLMATMCSARMFHMRAHMKKHTHVCSHTRMHTYTRMHTHTHTHTLTHTYMYTRPTYHTLQ